MSQGVREILGRESNATVELFFYAEDIPPLGLLSYHVERVNGGVVPVAVHQNLSIPSPNVTAPLETSQETPDNIEVKTGVSFPKLRMGFQFTKQNEMFMRMDPEREVEGIVPPSYIVNLRKNYFKILFSAFSSNL